MNTAGQQKEQQGGAILVYFIMMGIFASAIAGLGAYVTQTTNLAKRRSDMTAAQQYVEGGAVIGCADVKTAYTTNSLFPANLQPLFGYTRVGSLSGPTRTYSRTISSPFTNQTVAVQIIVPNVASPSTAQVVTTATVGDVTQTATVNVLMNFAYPAAIISVNDGTTDTSVAKSAAQDGNVVINGGGAGPLIVDGNSGLAAMANGRVNVDTTNNATVPNSSISMTNANTANELPNLTGTGTNALFDFNRFIAIANATTNLLNAGPKNNHFTNVLSFANAMNAASNHTLEGVIVVDISKSDGNWQKAADSSLFTSGINIHGTLFYNFGPEFGITDKFIANTAININAADLSSMVATNATTYPNGYPAVYMDPTKNATNANITSHGFANVSPSEDLPALMYNIGEVDIHGPVNISGVCYTPSYMEIENKQDGQTQYFKGSLIVGNGVYLENNDRSTTIVSFSPSAIDSLSTLNNKGKTVRVAYWQ